MKLNWESSPRSLVIRLYDRLSPVENELLLSLVWRDLRNSQREVIIDLARVEDLGSGTLSVICGLARLLATHGTTLYLANPRPALARYLELFTGLRQSYRLLRTAS